MEGSRGDEAVDRPGRRGDDSGIPQALRGHFEVDRHWIVVAHQADDLVVRCYARYAARKRRK